MTNLDDLEKGVLKSLPEIAEIANGELREKVMKAWALALSETEFQSLDDIPCSSNVGRLNFVEKTQADHHRGVGRIARAIAEEMNDLYGEKIDLDLELALAGGIVHDIGKPHAFDKRNIKRWKENSVKVGQPPIRHTAYGAHLAITVGLPEEIVNIIALHEINKEAQYARLSVYTELVALADVAYWEILKHLNLLGKDPTSIDPGISY